MKKNTFFTVLFGLFFTLSLISQTNYYVKSTGNDTTGLDETNAFTTIANALTAAVNGDTIIVDGTISQTSQYTIGKSVTITGQNNATIEGATGSSRLFLVSDVQTILFSNITFQNNQAPVFGSVLRVDGVAANITFQNCNFFNNASTTMTTVGTGQGGVLWFNFGTFTITNCLFSGNSATNQGGAIYVAGTSNSTLTISGSVFKGNTAGIIPNQTSYRGGAIYANTHNIVVTNTVFYNNKSSNQGGAIYTINAQSTNNSRLENVTMYQNKLGAGTTNGDLGPAIRMEGNPAAFEIKNSLSFDNRADDGNGNQRDASDGGNIVSTITNSIFGPVNAINNNSGSNIDSNLSTSNLTWDDTNNRLTFTAPSLLTDTTPIDFGTNNSDVGAWDSKINLFKGTDDSDWATGANWSSTAIPTSLENVTLLSDSPALVIGGSTTATINNLSVNGSSSLTINSGGSLIVSGTSTGNVTYNRNLLTTNWYLVSSPVSGQAYNDAYVTANGIASGTGANRGIASYTTADNTWSYFQATGSGTFNNGQGYSVKRTATGDISFTGTINTADVSVAVSNAGNGFNLIGNPYTSHVNSATFLTDNSANLVSETIWVWNGSSYDTHITAVPFTLAPAQGFFVRSSNGTNLNFAEGNQASTGGTFQKSSNTEVKLMMNDGSNNRFAKMYYLENATKGFDNGFDGETFGGIENSVDVFTNLVENNEGKKFQVQSLPISEMETMIVPVGVKAAAGKQITFTAEALNLPGDTKVFLEDRLTNTITRLDEANASYKVTLNDAINGTGRFYLHTKASGVLSTDDVVLQNISIYATNKSTLRVVGLTQGKATVKVFNILGKQMMQSSFTTTGSQDISLPKLATGMYIVQLETATGKLNKKIVLE